MDPIILSAIKKAKKELEEKHQVSAQTLDDLKSALTDLKDTKLPRWVQDILDKVDQSTDSTGTTLSQLKSSLEEKLSPWTGTRAAKLDNLDAKVSSRADGSYYTPARGNKLDKLDATVSSRLSKTDFDTESAALKSDISGKIDTQGAALSEAVNDIKNNLFLTPDTRLSVYSIDFNREADKTFFAPRNLSPNTTIYSVNGKGKLMCFMGSMTPYHGPMGAIFRIEKDGKVFARVKIEYVENGGNTNAAIISAESLLFIDLLREKFFNVKHVPLNMNGDTLATSGDSLFGRSGASLVLNSYFGSSDLEFNKSLKVIFESLTPQGANGTFNYGAIHMSSLIRG